MSLSPEQFGLYARSDEGAHFRHDEHLAATDEERLQKKRFDSAFAFEMNHPPTKRTEVVRPSWH